MLALCGLWLSLPNASAAALDSWTTYTFPQIWLPNCWTNGSVYAGPNYTNTPHLWKVVFHKGAFVAAGTGPCVQDTPTVVLSSVDGISWQHTRPVDSANGFNGMTVSPEYIMGVGFWGARVRSGEGLSWTSGVEVASGNLYAVTYGAGRFVAGGYADDFTRGRIVTSTNGLDWRTATFFGNPTNEFVGVAFGNGTFRAITPTRNYTSDTNATNFLSASGSSQNRLICFGNDRFIRVSDQLHVYTRPSPTDPMSWVLTPWPTAIPFERITFGAGLFLATAGRDVASSTNGFDWTVHTNALPSSVADVTYGHGVFMAVAGWKYYVSQPIAGLRHGPVPGTLWLDGLPNRQYDIVGTNQITSSNWPVLGRVTITNSSQLWTDTNALSHSRRFYRTQLVP